MALEVGGGFLLTATDRLAWVVFDVRVPVVPVEYVRFLAPVSRLAVATASRVVRPMKEKNTSYFSAMQYG